MTPNETAEREALAALSDATIPESSRYVSAVREYRNHAGCLLVEAKEAVDALRAASPVTPQVQAVASPAVNAAEGEPCTHCNGRKLLPWWDGSWTLPCPWCTQPQATPSARDCDSPASGESALVVAARKAELAMSETATYLRDAANSPLQAVYLEQFADELRRALEE